MSRTPTSRDAPAAVTLRAFDPALDFPAAAELIAAAHRRDGILYRPAPRGPA